MHCRLQCAARTLLRSFIPIFVCLAAMPPAHAASVSPLALQLSQTVSAPRSALAQPQAAPLALSEALEIATRDSPLLSAQRSAVTAAEQSVIPARELPDPKLRAGIDNLPVNGPDRFSLERDFMTMRKIGVMQDFPRAIKRELRGQRAENELGREQAMLADARITVRRDVALAWTERYFAERMAGVIDEQLAETKLQRETAQAGLRANKVPAGDILALDVSLQTLLDRRAEFEQAGRASRRLRCPDGSVRRARVRWRRRLRSSGQRPRSIPKPTSLIILISRCCSARSTSAQSEADLARVATQPDWGVEVTYAQRGPPYSNMVSVQVSIDLPVFQARRQQPALAAKLAQVEQARALREESLRQHFAEARVALAEWEAASARLKRFDDSLLPLARERAKLALAAYRGGQGPLAPVLDARRSELELKTAETPARRRAGARLRAAPLLPARGECEMNRNLILILLAAIVLAAFGAGGGYWLAMHRMSRAEKTQNERRCPPREPARRSIRPPDAKSSTGTIRWCRVRSSTSPASRLSWICSSCRSTRTKRATKAKSRSIRGSCKTSASARRRRKRNRMDAGFSAVGAR